MNIFHKVVLQGLKKSRTRTVVTIVGVILSAAMITAVTTFAVSLMDYMVNGAVQKYGNWHAAFLDATPSFAEERMQDNEVTDTSVFANVGYAEVPGGKNPDKPYYFIAGYYQDTFETLPTTVVSGRLPQNSNEILISSSLARDGGISYALGDTITFTIGNRISGEKKLTLQDPYTPGNESFVPMEERSYTVVGIGRRPVFQEDSAPVYTLITKMEETVQAEDLSLFITLKNPRTVYSYVEQVKGDHISLLNYDVLRMMGLSDHPSDRVLMTFLYSAGVIVLLIIMIGSVFLIYNSFSIALNERTREFGILASVGATARQLRNSVLFEGICIGAVGIPIGLAVGLCCIWLVLSVVGKRFGTILYENVPLTMHISVPAILCAIAVSMVTILISAYIPAKRAASMPVMECIRQTNEIKVESRAIKTSKIEQRIYGLEGILALKNFKRNKKRYRSIVLSLILSIVLFISTDALANGMNQTTAGSKEISSFDIGFGTKEMDTGEMLQLYEKLKTAGGVSHSSYQLLMKCSCMVPAEELTEDFMRCAGNYVFNGTAEIPMEVQFFDDGTYQKMLEEWGLSVEEYTGVNGKVIAVAKMNEENAEGVLQLPNVFNNSSVNLTIVPAANQEANMETDAGLNTEINVEANAEMNETQNTALSENFQAAIIEAVPPDVPPIMEGTEELPYYFQILAPWSLKEAMIPDDRSVDVPVKGLTFQSENPSQSAAEMESMIEESGITSEYLFINTAKALEELHNYLFVANVFAYTFIALISLIAVANVFNTISTNIRLRRRELAMLRSVGMRDRDFNRMMCFECAFYGMRALAIGIPLAIVCSLLVHWGMVTDEVKYILPWGSIIISVFSVFLIIFITMMYAVSKIKKENIIDALRDEMT